MKNWFKRRIRRRQWKLYGETGRNLRNLEVHRRSLTPMQFVLEPDLVSELDAQIRYQKKLRQDLFTILSKED